MRNTTLWHPEQPCPYGKECELPVDCPGVELDLPARLEKKLREDGFDVIPGTSFSATSVGSKALNFCSVRVCDKALEDPDTLEKVSLLTLLEIDI